MPRLNRIILVNKPAGITSQKLVHKISTKLKQLTGNKFKLGHTGTLDPFATGLMLVCINQATRLASYFSNCYKSYSASLQLGAKTDTADTTGKVLETCEVPQIGSLLELQKIAQEMQSTKSLRVPDYSAKRIDGHRRYTLARQGIAINPQFQSVDIAECAITAYDHEKKILDFHARVSSGTYIRSLGELIAEQLGTCGYLSSLVRTSIGNMQLTSALELDTILGATEDEFWAETLSIQETQLFREVRISKKQAQDFVQGKAVACEPDFQVGSERVLLIEEERGLELGLAEFVQEPARLVPRVVLWHFSELLIVNC